MKKSESSNDMSNDMSESFSGTANFGSFEATISGSVSSHEANTRSSDNSAKYHVDVHATNHGIPEGLARVLDMMAECVAPESVGSTIVGDDGNLMEGERKNRIQKLKLLQNEIALLKRKVKAATDSLEIKLNRIKKEASNKQCVYSMRMTQLIEKTEDEELLNQYKNKQETISSQWKDFIGNVRSRIDLLYSLNVSSEDEYGQYIELHGITIEGQDEDVITSLAPFITAALEAYKIVYDITKQLEDKQDEYNQINLGV